MSNPFAFFVDKILIGYIAYSPFFRKLARFVNNNFQFKNGLAIHTHGFTLYARSPDRILALYLGKYSLLDSFESKLLKTLVSEGMTVIDIGANIGFYTLQLAALAGRNGHVYAFEPDTDNFRLLKRNLAVNSMTNVTPVSKAVSDKTGIARLYICEEHHGNHTIYDDGTGRKWVTKKSITMDDFCGNLIKIRQPAL